MLKKVKNIKFERHFADTLPLHIVMDMCSPGRVSAACRQYLFLWSELNSPKGIDHFVSSAKLWAKNNREELESVLMSRSTSAPVVWASKNGRLLKEREFMELCRQTPKGRKHWIQYCHQFTLVPENLTEITLEVAFGEQSRRGKEYIKKIQKTKQKCLAFIRTLMESEGIKSEDTIQRLIERLS
jgi:hypothetical protein